MPGGKHLKYGIRKKVLYNIPAALKNYKKQTFPLAVMPRNKEFRANIEK
jgi:hypothetical protein